MNSNELQGSVAVSVVEAARRLGISPRTVATLIATNELASRRIGRRRVVPIEALEAFIRCDHAIVAASTAQNLTRRVPRLTCTACGRQLTNNAGKAVVRVDGGSGEL